MPPPPVQGSSQMPLAPSSCQSRLSVNYKGDNEIIPVAVHRSPGIYLTTEETPRKPQLGDSLNAVWSVIASNGVPYFQMSSVGSGTTSGREKEGKKIENKTRVHFVFDCRTLSYSWLNYFGLLFVEPKTISSVSIKELYLFLKIQE
jgi:hypothetical protein